MSSALADRPAVVEREDGRTPFSVRIGVTGHRDPSDLTAVTRGVQGCLRAIADAFPPTAATAVRFTILSALAEGADRLVVCEALKVLGADCVDLHAVLPLDPEEYVDDFPGSREEFEALLDRASTCTRTPETGDRDAAYERAGRWIVEHADLVIALWDGRPSSGRGGTAEIAGYARERGLPVLVVPTARGAGSAPRPVEWPIDLAKDPLPAHDAFARIDRLNRDAIDIDAYAVLEAALGRAARGTAMHELYQTTAKWALPRLVRADVLAMYYQRWYYRSDDVLYGLASLAVIVVAAQATAKLSALFALGEVASMLIVLGILRTARRAQLHTRWIGYRSLAEALRSAIFIALAGIDVPTDSDTAELGDGAEPWFQRAFTEAWKHVPKMTPRSADVADLRRFLTEAWIIDQINYHTRAAARFRRARTRLTRAILGLFTLTLLAGIGHAFGFASSQERLLVFLAIVLPAIGAALTGVRDQRQYRLHEDRSLRAAQRLDGLRRKMEAARDLVAVQKLTAQVQAVIAAEKLDWSGVAEFQDLEMVI